MQHVHRWHKQCEVRFTERVTMITKQQVMDAINNDVIDGDGHSIMDPTFYTDAGFDCEHLTTEFESDFSSGKTTIYKNGVPFGTEQSNNTLWPAVTSYTEDLSFEPGDTMELWTRISNVAAYAKARLSISVLLIGLRQLLKPTQPDCCNAYISLRRSPLSPVVSAPRVTT